MTPNWLLFHLFSDCSMQVSLEIKTKIKNFPITKLIFSVSSHKILLYPGDSFPKFKPNFVLARHEVSERSKLHRLPGSLHEFLFVNEVADILVLYCYQMYWSFHGTILGEDTPPTQAHTFWK